MTVTYNGAQPKPTQPPAPPTQTTSTNAPPKKEKPKRGNAHQQPKPLPASMLDIDESRIRVAHWLTLLGNLSASAFYQRLAKSEIPPPCGKDPRPFWRARAVREFLAK